MSDSAKMFPRVEILGVLVHAVGRRRVREVCRVWLTGSSLHRLVTVNPEILLRAARDAAFRGVLNTADLVVADGIGIRWAAAFLESARGVLSRSTLVWRFLRTGVAFAVSPSGTPSPLPERVAGVDILTDLVSVAADVGASVYLLGGFGGTAVRAAAYLRKQNPRARIAAFAPDHPATEEASAALSAHIASSAPVVLFVGYGAPAQEQWIVKNARRFPSVRIAVGVGGALDMLAGNVPRAPAWLRQRGLEWVWRLLREPRRLPRILHATLTFPVTILRFCLRPGREGTSARDSLFT